MSGKDQPIVPRPSVADLLKEIGDGGNAVPTDKPEEPAPSEGKVDDEITRQLSFAKLTAFTNHHESKKHWSLFMMATMAALVLFQMILLAKVGAGKWDFTAYEWLLPLLLVQNFAQIVGLALVVVKALFDNFKE